nr:RNA-directed DNA polymerase, eukaryota [Tanacetum cinerariifolium]
HHLYANQVRFERPQKPNFPSLNDTNRVSEKTHYVSGCRQSKGLDGSYVNAVNGIPPSVQPGTLISSSPSMVLDDSCIIERDFSKQVMGRVKDFNFIPNLPTILSDEGFADVKLLYLGGFWVMLEFDMVETKSKLMQHTGGVPLYAWSRKTFSRIGNKWGETLNIEDTNDSSFGRKCLCIKTKHPVSILESFKIIVKVKDTVQDIGDIDGNFFKESSPVINAKVMNNFQSVQEEEICDSGQRNSSGILCIWEATVFKKEYVTISDNFVAIYGTWLPNNSRILFVVVYAPKQVSSKRVLWDYMSVLLSRWNGKVIMMGDFNEVRSRDERRGSWFNPSSARVFNQFIFSSGLVDIKMKGYTFTWSHPSVTKMSKLDRFLVSDGIFLEFPSISALCLDRHLSDYRSILLHDVQLDFGLVHSWFSFDGFDDMVERTWRSFSHSDGNGMILFKKKIQELKIDKELDQGVVSYVNLLRRLDLNHQLHDINIKEATNSFQKSKVRWAIEGDENSKFFHGIINKKRSQLAIRGVFVDVTDLERRVSRNEIRMAVWNCGENKSPVPDGFTFEFLGDTGISLVQISVMDAKFVNDYRPISLIGSVYKVITKILANHLAVVIADIVSDTQFAFITERQILDGSFILNEVLHWCKRKNKKAMFFKVDFA